jgi:hypothetical protein
VYAQALWQTGASVRDWLWFGYDVWRQVSGQSYSAAAAPDASTTACCVYTEADVDHAVERYGVPRPAVFAVGNLDLARFDMQEEDMGLCLSSERKVVREIVYVATALAESGAIFDDAEDFARHLEETRDALARQGFSLVVKLHPAQLHAGLLKRLRQVGIELCGNEDFVRRLKASTAAIVEPSSAAIIPALLGLPLLLARYGKLSEQEYGVVLTGYPLARTLYSLDELASLLADIAATSSADAARAWINVNAGPLPVGKMPERVADVLEGLVRTRKGVLACE